jgi:hypothetical protein
MATITIANGDWGNIKTGDKMRWKYFQSVEGPEYVNFEILDISGEYITIKEVRTTLDRSPTSSSTYNRSYLWQFIISQSYLQEWKADIKDDDNLTIETVKYEWVKQTTRHIT